MDNLDRYFRSHYIETSCGCWIWTGASGDCGTSRYGFFSSGVKLMRAHRWSYERFIGPIPLKMVIHHKCNQTLCVNPNHLEPTTKQRNRLLGRFPQTT